ncbi:hypothetical protein [Chryseolinea lacunae]|uniref:BZIP transcription factor n=1 Tax=Chryseolinea lacunae TaxID=2801331 RepID=A0ABS1KUE0_9BACT|nr:hypothetical protein [Chryseolinea lacunae]MBL0743095.1 hypothetical protein [Chryseolinea lacunae]
MRKLFFAILTLGLYGVQTVNAQWNNQTTYIYYNGNVRIGTNVNSRGRFDVSGPGDIYLAESTTLGTGQSLYLPGHIFMAPYNGGDMTFLQARRSDTSGSTSLRIRTTNSGVITEAIQVDPNGNVGIGFMTPYEKLCVYGNAFVTGNVNISQQSAFGMSTATDKFTYDGKSVGNYSLGWYPDSWLSGAASGYLSAHAGLKIFTNGAARMVVTYNGNVGIGTTNPNPYAKLTVAGDINAREVRVTVDAGADFVFDNDYSLKDLKDVDQYIKEHKHLPGIASAEEMKSEGVELGKMDVKLLQKIEELTLYLIDLKKEIENLKVENKTLKVEVETLKSDN